MANVKCRNTRKIGVCMLLTMMIVFSCASTKKDFVLVKTIEKTHKVNNSSTMKSVEKIYTFPDAEYNVFMRNKVTEYTSSSGNTFVVLESAHGHSLVTVTVSAKGFPMNDNFVVSLGEINPIVNLWQTDLNNDGYDEWFIVTRGVGSGGYGEMFGYVSDKDKELLYVKIPELTEKETMGYDYRGRDTFYLPYQGADTGAIVREFPLYNEDDPNSSPTGGRARIQYSLIKKGSGFVLAPVNIDQESQ